MTRRIDITGHRFGKLTAAYPIKNAKKSSWVCNCDCGAELVVTTTNLRSGNSKSCGCLTPDVARGWNGTPEYTAFRNALNRCNRPQDVRYQKYGGRGIKFKFETMDDFIAAIGPRPSASHSLDRIDPDGHYEAGNVRWATDKEQARNKTSNLLIEIDGQTKTLKEWCEVYGQKYKRAWERIRDGWTPIDALTIPATRKAVCDGLNRIAWADDAQIAEATVSKVWGITEQTVVHVESA